MEFNIFREWFELEGYFIHSVFAASDNGIAGRAGTAGIIGIAL